MRISDASRPQCRLVTPRATPSACLIAYWVRRKAWKPSNTVSHASCVPLEGNGGAKRRSCRPDGGAYVRPSPCRTPSVRPPTSDCRPQGGHPCIERMRDAHGRSNVPRPLQSRFKARKKPEGYTSTPTGLKRLKTQNTAVHGNVNGKGTPSGVPQPIHKRKLILVKEEFDASSFGGDGGNRTRVRKPVTGAFYECSGSFDIPSAHRRTAGFAHQ